MSVSDTKTRILEACHACIARNGVRGLRIQDVATEADVSNGLLYYHFTDRDGLLRAALDFVDIELSTRSSGLAANLHPRERLRKKLFQEFGEGSIRSGSIVWNELRAAAVFEPPIAEQLNQTTQRWDAEVAELIQEIDRNQRTDGSGKSPSAKNDWHESDPTGIHRARILTVTVEGLSSRWLSDQLQVDDARTQLEHVLDSLGLGLHENFTNTTPKQKRTQS